MVGFSIQLSRTRYALLLAASRAFPAKSRCGHDWLERAETRHSHLGKWAPRLDPKPPLVGPRDVCCPMTTQSRPFITSCRGGLNANSGDAP